MKTFITKFATSIVATLSCFDRVIFKGYLPFGNDAQLNLFVDRILRIRRKDFIPMIQGPTPCRSTSMATIGLLSKWPSNGSDSANRMKDNWLKMYDKFGQILRVETVINNPREFRVRRLRKRNGDHRMVWCPMNKGVANFYQLERVARTANDQYLKALSVVNDPAPSYQQAERLAERKVVAQRSYAGFNPASNHDVRLFQAVLAGDHLLNGFRNQDIRRYFGNDPKDPRLRRRLSARISRLLKRLHIRALIAKIPHTRRWRITQLGQKLLGAIVQLHYHGLARAICRRT